MRPGDYTSRVFRAALLCGWFGLACAEAVTVTGPLSPRSAERERRERTDYIILHTTEGSSRSSFNKLFANGEAHFFVDIDGSVRRIVHPRRIAFHAGRSMWNGRSNIDTCSIGIEVSGYHDRLPTRAQLKAMCGLLESLQAEYGVSDRNVLTHSMVAYGAPNKWYRTSHRGRKRCGMMFASTSVRASLGLDDRPGYDPDVRAGRLTVGDAYLADRLYGKKSVASVAAAARAAAPVSGARSSDAVAKASAAAAPAPLVAPASDAEAEGVREIGRDGATAWAIAGDEYRRKTTIYLLTDGRVRTGAELRESDLKALPRGTRILVGYVHGGYITRRRSPFDVCGRQWNSPGTFYRLPDGTLVAGNELKETAIPSQTMVFVSS